MLEHAKASDVLLKFQFLACAWTHHYALVANAGEEFVEEACIMLIYELVFSRIFCLGFMLRLLKQLSEHCILHMVPVQCLFSLLCRCILGVEAN